MTFTITNNTANPFTINSIEALDDYLIVVDYSYAGTLPATLAVGESWEVAVYPYLPVAKGYYETSIEIVTDIATQTIPVKINESIYTSVDENNVASFEVYPNPMNNTLYINGECTCMGEG